MEIVPNGNKKVLWKCNNGHKWEQELQIETMGKVIQSVIKLKERKNKIVNSRLKTL